MKQRELFRVWVWMAGVVVLSCSALSALESGRFSGVTYTYEANRAKHPFALDREATVLTDGKTNPGPWVAGGWAATLGAKGSPLTIRFDLGGWRRIDRIKLHYLHDWAAGITAPSRVKLTFGVEGRDVGETVMFSDFPVTGTGLQSVTIPLTRATGRYIEMTILNWRGGWTFLSEVSFAGGLEAPGMKGRR
ncbi:MAG: hypothetical protein HN919_09400 [Verrucomicrobia bacterium]|jgi:hypothetical protein|nr:hypothetical protein [Verrucomicrobiota bacterium]MBT7066504.1 hypothetical protein [Verrucomicrobiota bacterium]MBT7699948.1 hypothetical protein [Verrucomicrobiota bacterium]